ncbi:hypothetical protein F4809DRAFT_268447 [Biscogniauxia mediterranea]|nr:hypothetical protein F4809DRAFT_268447 [Biscogniauxia mediterranea]
MAQPETSAHWTRAENQECMEKVVLGVCTSIRLLHMYLLPTNVGIRSGVVSRDNLKSCNYFISYFIFWLLSSWIHILSHVTYLETIVHVLVRICQHQEILYIIYKTLRGPGPGLHYSEMARTKHKAGSKSKKAPAMAATRAAAPDPEPGARPLNGVYILVFLATAGLFTWLMRVELALKGLPVRFNEQVEAARLDDGTPLVTEFTGFAPLDEGLRFLTLAFIAGPAGLDPSVRLQQIHFLFTLFGALCVWNVEACRQRNAGRLISL